jgi:hypothetical protein
MKEPYPRRLAMALLCLGIRIAPPELADWGQAMLNEMRHVEGNWSALLWSLGGTGVLVKHALLALMFPSRSAIASSGELFAKDGHMRKMTLAITGACVVASLLFFLVPSYRQAIRVSLDPLYCAMYGDYGDRIGAELKAVAHQAEQKHDAEGIGFVAIRLGYGDKSESARLAEEAVHLDPTLTWLYAFVPAIFSSDSQTDRWVRELQKYDPQNALPYIVIARKINWDLFNTKRIIPRVQDEPSAWQNAMAAAGQSPKFDNYCSQFKALEHRVLLRYNFDDLGWRCSWEPGSGIDTVEYAASILEAGEALEARDDRKAAREKYMVVARFGQMFGSGRGFQMNGVIQSAYKHLEALSEKDGYHDRAELYAYLAVQTDRAEKEEETAREKNSRGRDVTRWNAFLARTAALSLLFSGGVLLVCFLLVIVRGRFPRLGPLRPGRPTLVLGACGSIGLLLSSAMLYATYKPYGEVFQRFIHTGDETEMRDFRSFISQAEIPFPIRNDVRFWSVVIALCVIALFFVLTRSLIKHLRATASI